MLIVTLVLMAVGYTVIRDVHMPFLGYALLGASVLSLTAATKNLPEREFRGLVLVTCLFAIWAGAWHHPLLALYGVALGIVPWIAHLIRRKRPNSR